MYTLPNQLQDLVEEGRLQQTVQDVLETAKKQGVDQAEVELTTLLELEGSVRMQALETLAFHREKGLIVTVYCDHRKGSASTTDLSPGALRETVETAVRLARATEPDPFSGLAEREAMTQSALPSLNLYHPWDLSVEKAVALAKLCEQRSLSEDPRIVNSEGATLCSTQSYRVYGNTHGFLGSYPTSRHSLSCIAIAEEKGCKERDGDYTVSRDWRQLESPERVGESAAIRALKRLHAQKLSTAAVPVLLQAEVAAGFLTHGVSALSGGRLFRKTSFLQDSLGKAIFPRFVSFYEEPHLQGGLRSAPFDREGVPTRQQLFVKEGEVVQYVLDAYSARKLGFPHTGNAGGVHNLFISPGEKDFEALVKYMDRGLVVTEVMGPGINLVTGDYSRGASGFWVEKGAIQFPVHEVVIAGNLRDLFQKVVAIGRDVDPRTGIYTGSVLIEEMMVAGK